MMESFGNTQKQMILRISKDSDFYQRSLLYGHPPKFIYLQVGNCPTLKIVQILRENYDTIIQFGDRESESILVLL